MAVCMARCAHKTPRKKGLGSARTPQQQEIGRRNTVTHARGKAPPSCCLQAAAVSLSRQPSGPARFELGWRGHVTARGILHCTAARCRQRCSASCLLSSRRLGSASLLVRRWDWDHGNRAGAGAAGAGPLFRFSSGTPHAPGRRCLLFHHPRTATRQSVPRCRFHPPIPRAQGRSRRQVPRSLQPTRART